MNTPTDVLQAMITPVVLISASGTLILSTSNRTARVTERVREISQAARREPATERAALAHQLELLEPRLLLLRSALLALYLSVGTLVATVFLIGMGRYLEWFEGWAVVWTGLAGTGLLFFACVQLVREARLAMRSTLEELERVRGSL